MTTIRTFGFKPMHAEIEVKPLAFVRELPNLLGRPHRAAFCQLLWLTRGTMTMRIDFRDICLREGDAMLISCGQMCQYDITSAYDGFAVLFTRDFFTETEVDATFLHSSETLNPTSMNVPVKASAELINSSIALLRSELASAPDTYGRSISRSLLRMMLYEMERKRTSAKTEAMMPDPVTRRFFHLVEMHYKTERAAAFYSQKLGVCEKALTNGLRESIGLGVKEYIDSRTMLEAKRMLAYTLMSAKEIGYELGFDEPTNFNKFFRRHCGTTPLEFREKSSPAR